MNFRINLTESYINFSRQENLHQIDVLYHYMHCLTPEILRFHPIPPFHFSFSVPLSQILPFKNDHLCR